ncbi:MAG: hypothetical protein NPIRA02_04280 [Nitrospirales bacterium]|nr:MAG: hypothetical protein NPIRA02_04280 [Nitrospirales bacterium]
MDAAFGVVLEGNSKFLVEIANALANPKWGIWLGRKSCVPSVPVVAGVAEDRGEALKLLIGSKNLESFTRQVEVADFADGQDSISDAPISFAIERRLHCTPRRVRTLQGVERL